MDLSVVSKFMSLDPDMMYKATRMVESVVVYYPGDADAQFKYLSDNLMGESLEYALILLEDKKLRDYMGVAIYTNGTTFSAPTAALYNVASMPEMKKRIQAKLNGKDAVRKESLDPVGKEDCDIDNDGEKNDKNDKYIRRRRGAISKAISNRSQKNEENESYNIDRLADLASEYFITEGLNEYGIDMLIEDMGVDDFCDYIEELDEYELLTEWRRGAGGTRVKGSATSKTGKSIGSLKGAAKSASIRGTAEHKARKASREEEPSKSSGMSSALKSQSKVASAKKSQPETKSTPTQTKEKAKGGILGALKSRAQRDTALLKKSVKTATEVGTRRAAEVKATYDAVRARGKQVEKSPSAVRGRRKATVAVGRTAQKAGEIASKAGRSAVKAAGAAGAAAGQSVNARKSGKSLAATAGRAVGTFIKKMRKEDTDLLTQYFIESEIAFNYDEVQEIFETLDQEHYEYYMEKALLMVEESNQSSAKDIIQEKLGTVYNASDFTLSNWRSMFEENQDSNDTTTKKFVKSTQVSRSDNTPNVKGKRKDGVIINPKIDMRSEEAEALDELNRYAKETGKSFRTGREVVPGGKAKNDKVFQRMSKMLGNSRFGAQNRGVKKTPGEKPPVAGEYGAPQTPAQKVANRRIAARNSKENQST